MVFRLPQCRQPRRHILSCQTPSYLVDMRTFLDGSNGNGERISSHMNTSSFFIWTSDASVCLQERLSCLNLLLAVENWAPQPFMPQICTFLKVIFVFSTVRLSSLLGFSTWSRVQNNKRTRAIMLQLRYRVCW